MGIPAVVGLNNITALVSGGDELIIDGTRGTVVINPDQPTTEQFRQYDRELITLGEELRTLRDLPAVTKCGTKIQLLGNIEFPSEAQTCLDNGAEGIGLYRTEFLHLGRETEPTEEEHYQAYSQTLQVMGDRPLVIRTLDLGADKYTQARAVAPERNPFLGCRSIRFCLQPDRLPLFRRQLRAMLRASAHGDVRILLPLITTLTELRQARMILGEVSEELDEQGVAYRRDIPIGIMVETPSAALSAPIFAPEASFFSIGTNDLIQYTLAVDRANEHVASLFTPANPALIRMIRDVIKAGRRYDIPVALCGEMASQLEFCLLLLGLGLRQFSVAPQAIPSVKKLIRASTLAHAQRVARRVMDLHTDRQILHYLRRETRKVFPDLV
jgi:phosphotransferase system enzyme I (PtsI)